jgi:flavorubredoxin
MYDLQVGGNLPFVDLIEEADGLAIGSPTINGDAVKPVWDLLSSLAVIKVRDKLGAAFGSYGWSGEAINMIEDRLRGLKLRVPIKGVRARLIPTEEELDRCRDLGMQLAQHLTGTVQNRVISMSELLASSHA